MSPGDDDQVTTVSPYYKIILLAVITIFVVGMAAYAILGMTVHDPISQTQGRVFDVLDFIVKSTLGAILGLLGAKVS